MFKVKPVLDENHVRKWTKTDHDVILNLLNEILAIEIVCVLRYKRQESVAKEVHAASLVDEFQKLAQDAQRHVDLVAERITRLKGEPNFTPVRHLMDNHSEYVEGNSLQEIIKKDWVSLRNAIDSYHAMSQVIEEKDPITYRLVENIVASEEAHADTLIGLIMSLDPKIVTSSISQSESNI